MCEKLEGDSFLETKPNQNPKQNQTPTLQKWRNCRDNVLPTRTKRWIPDVNDSAISSLEDPLRLSQVQKVHKKPYSTLMYFHVIFFVYFSTNRVFCSLYTTCFSYPAWENFINSAAKK